MEESKNKELATNAGAPVTDNQNILTAGRRGPALLQDAWYLEKLGHLDREVIQERRMHAKDSGAYGTFTITRDITKYTKAKIFSAVGKKTEMFEWKDQPDFSEPPLALEGDARQKIKLRHIDNCAKADPAYGAGVAAALGLAVAETAAAGKTG
jgi:catalase